MLSLFYYFRPSSNDNNVKAKYLMKLKHFIADFDGTICQMFTPQTKQYLIDEIYNYLRQFDIEESIKLINDPYKIWIKSYNQISRTLDNKQREALFKDSSEVFLELEKEVAYYSTAYENMIETYEWISQNFITNSIVSTNHAEAITIGLEKARLTKYVGQIFGREQISCFSQLKPDNFLLEKALIQTGASRENSLYIGDNEVDMIAAKNTGIFAVGVLRGRERKDSLENSGANLIIENFEDIQNEFYTMK